MQDHCIKFWDVISIFLTPDAMHLSLYSTHCTTFQIKYNSIAQFDIFIKHNRIYLFVDLCKYCLYLSGSPNLGCKYMYYN